MEEINGMTVKQYLQSLGDLSSEENKEAVSNIAVLIGNAVSKLHTLNVMHGDLTTSNMLIPHSCFKKTLPASATASAAAVVAATVDESKVKVREPVISFLYSFQVISLLFLS